MFLIRSHNPQPPGPTLHITPPAPDDHARRARHLATCEELAELGMDIARAAHREALRDMQPPPSPRAPIPGLTYDHAPASPPRDAIFGQLFALISRCVRQTMLLEDRLASGTLDHPSHEPTPRTLQPTPPLPEPPDSTRLCADRLYREPCEAECLHTDARPIATILTDIRSELGAATSAGLTPRRPEPTHTRRPIPVIPPGPEPPLTEMERSALYYLATNPKPPDRRR